MKNKYLENTDHRIEANGVCLVLRESFGRMAQTKVIEKEFFFGKNAELEAKRTLDRWLSPEGISDLAPGLVFEVRLHPAFRGDDSLTGEPDEYDPSENLAEVLRFTVKQVKTLEKL